MPTESVKDIFDIVLERDRKRQEEERIGKRRSEAGLPASVMEFAGGRLDNMPPANSNSGPGEVVSTSGGVDWLAVGFEAYHDDFDCLRAEFETCRERAQEAGERVPCCVRGVDCEIEPGGAGNGGSYTRYVIRYCGWVIRIKDKPESDGNPNVFAEVTGEALLACGLAELLRRLDGLLRDWRIITGKSYVSRADVCADVPGMEVRPFYDAVMAGQAIGRANKFGIHGDWHKGRIETISFGSKKSACRLTIYDKVVETAGHSRKQGYMIQKRWGGEMPESAVRVEFRLRREKLVDLNAGTLEGLLSSLQRITRYLCCEWFRFSPRDVNRENTSREGVSDEWAEVQKAFAAWSQHWTGEGSVPLKKGKTTAKALVQQAVGCLQRVWAELGCVPSTAEEAIAAVSSVVGEQFAKIDQLTGENAFVEGVVQKVSRIRHYDPGELAKFYGDLGLGKPIALIGSDSEF